MKKLRIVHDTHPMNPRDGDNLGKIACKSARYDLGEEEISDPIEWLENMLGLSHKGVYSNERLLELEDKFFKKYIGHRVYIYDHSGIALSTSPFQCRWDSGQVGYIFISRKDAAKEYGRLNSKKILKILEYLDNEVKDYSSFFEGDVYGYIIEDEDGYEIDSCYGFLGTDWKKNGMADNLEPALWPQLEDAETEYETSY